MKYQDVIKNIKQSNHSIKTAAQQKIDNKTKPLGSLGILEEIAVKLTMIQNNLDPEIFHKAMVVFAGDHGITEEAVSNFPAEVTPQMVYNFLNGNAAINVLCRHNNIQINIIDIGVNHEFPKIPTLISKKVRKGTRNFLKESAMTLDETYQCLQYGIDTFIEIYQKQKIDLLGVGDMGIGNTTSSAAIIAAVTGISPDKITGRGTGINNEQYANKIEIIKKALAYHQPDPKNALDILTKIGGYEIGGIAGAILASASHQVPVVLDGIIATAGGLLASLIQPETTDYLFAGHSSVEIGQKAALEYMGLKPILDLNLRLGEGTGSALAMNIIEAGAKIMKEMSSFEDAGVSNAVK